MVDEKTILSIGFKLITEAFTWIDEDNDAAYKDFYNYTSGVSDLVNLLIEKLDKEED